ncbi:hypothetical protein ACPS74_13335 [Methylocystis sp. SB2]
MQPLARLAEIAKEQRRLADEAEQLIATIDGRSAGPPEAKQSDRWLNTKQAMRLARVDSSSTLYRWARRFGVGEKTPAGGWRFSERSVLELLAVEKSANGENGENGDGAPVPMANERAHAEDEH